MELGRKAVMDLVKYRKLIAVLAGILAVFIMGWIGVTVEAAYHAVIGVVAAFCAGNAVENFKSSRSKGNKDAL